MHPPALSVMEDVVRNLILAPDGVIVVKKPAAMSLVSISAQITLSVFRSLQISASSLSCSTFIVLIGWSNDPLEKHWWAIQPLPRQFQLGHTLTVTSVLNVIQPKFKPNTQKLCKSTSDGIFRGIFMPKLKMHLRSGGYKWTYWLMGRRYKSEGVEENRVKERDRVPQREACTGIMSEGFSLSVSLVLLHDFLADVKDWMFHNLLSSKTGIIRGKEEKLEWLQSVLCFFFFCRMHSLLSPSLLISLFLSVPSSLYSVFLSLLFISQKKL